MLLWALWIFCLAVRRRPDLRKIETGVKGDWTTVPESTKKGGRAAWYYSVVIAVLGEKTGNYAGVRQARQRWYVVR